MSSATLEWLKNNTRIYHNSTEVYNHVAAALAHPAARALRPRTAVYTFNDGRTQILLCLHGLIPISYRNASYNIPIHVWFPIDYPANPPIVFVVPTSDMLVTPSVHVDLSGLTTIPYIHNWKAKPESCNVLALIEALQEHFSLQPPLYAKPKQSQVIPPPPPPPPRPVSMIQSPPSTSTQPTPHHRYSTPPAPPQSSPKPPPPFAHHQASPLHPSSPSSQQSPPPVPPPPPNAAIRPPRFQSLSPSPSSSTSPPPPPFLPPNFLSPTHTPGHGAQQFTRQHSQSTQFSPPLPPPVPHQPPPLVVPPAIVAPKIPPPNLMDDSEASSSLSQAPEHAVPPRPLNPALLALHANLHQKFSSSLQALSITHQETFSKLLSMQADLLKGPPAIADESARLEAVKELCTTVARRVGEVVRDAEGRIEDVKRRGEPSVDELVCSSDVVYNQLIDLVAEDNAIEDTIYHLHRAHNAGRIDLEKFLRTTRALAEEQFMKRALIEKIVEETRLGR